MISLKFKKIGILILLSVIFFSHPATSQTKRFEIQYGIGGVYGKNQREKPEIKKTDFLNNKLNLGFRLLPYLSLGISSNYIFRKSYEKNYRLILPDKILFEQQIRKDKNIGIGPYLKFSIGQNFNFSMASGFNYCIGAVNIVSSTEWQEYTEKNNNELSYTSKFVFLDLSIGKRVYENFFINLSFNEQYVFFKKFSPNSSGIFKAYSRYYYGINFNYFFNLKKIQK